MTTKSLSRVRLANKYGNILNNKGISTNTICKMLLLISGNYSYIVVTEINFTNLTITYKNLVDERLSGTLMMGTFVSMEWEAVP